MFYFYKVYLQFLSLFVLILCLTLPLKSSSQSISTSKKVYDSYDTIDVKFSNVGSTQQNWIGLHKIDSENMISFSQTHMLKSISNGTVSFHGYLNGEYAVQLFLDWPKQGYNAREHVNIEFQSGIIPNDSIVQYPTKQLKHKWKDLGLDNDDLSLDYDAELAVTMSANWIIEGFPKENNSIRFARLEAALKRNILQLLISKGLYANASLPSISKNEVNLIAKEYEKLDSFGKRWRFWDAIWRGILYITDNTHSKFINNRLKHSFDSENFTQILSPLCTATQLTEVFTFISDAESLKDSWRFQFPYFEEYSCKGYSIWCFKNYLTSEIYEKIENLNSQEKRFFISNKLLPPLFPPWQRDLSVECIKSH